MWGVVSSLFSSRHKPSVTLPQPATREDVRQWLSQDEKVRVLSLDGGGIRGALTTAFLVEVEAKLRDHYKCPDLLLCDYFQYVGGTSTGSLIAAGVAMGMSATKLNSIYLERGTSIFSLTRTYLRGGILEYFGVPQLADKMLTKYEANKLDDLLQSELGKDVTFASPKLQCNLLVLAECATASCLSHPAQSAVIFSSIKDSVGYNYSKDVKLWQACRASSAAPMYFPPMTFNWSDGGVVPFVGRGRYLPKHSVKPEVQPCDFIDGALAGYNNPEAAIVRYITQPRYCTEFKPDKTQRPVFEGSPARVLLFSVGTGHGVKKLPQGTLKDYKGWDWGFFVVEKFISGDEAHEALSAAMECHNVVDLDWTTHERPLFSSVPKDRKKYYLAWRQRATRLRYNVSLDVDTLKQIGIDATPEQIEKLAAMDNVEKKNVDLLSEIGTRLATTYFNKDHMTDFL